MIHDDESSWCSMMIHHDESLRCIVMILHCMSSWCIMMIHHDESSWCITMVHRCESSSSSWSSSCIMMTHHFQDWTYSLVTILTWAWDDHIKMYTYIYIYIYEIHGDRCAQILISNSHGMAALVSFLRAWDNCSEYSASIETMFVYRPV